MINKTRCQLFGHKIVTRVDNGWLCTRCGKFTYSLKALIEKGRLARAIDNRPHMEKFKQGGDDAQKATGK